MSDVVVFQGRTQLANDLSQMNIAEIHLLDMIAFSKVFEESINRFFATVLEDVSSTHAKRFKIRALLGEMTQPAELLTAAWAVACSEIAGV